MSEQKSHIDFRVSPKEKETIDRIAAKCGLSTSEYLRQRTLGFAPRALPPEPFWRFLETAADLMEKGTSPEVNDALLQLIHDTAEDVLIPGKDRPKYAPKSQQRQPKAKPSVSGINWDDDALWGVDPFDYSDNPDDWEAV